MKANLLGLALLLLIGSSHPVMSQQNPSQELRVADNNSSRHSVAASPLPREPVPLIHSRQTSFAIPFTINQTEARPLEVALLVSGDRGATWSTYARQAAGQGQFLFRAARDGEYWFASRTIPTGLPVPNLPPIQPELRVAVDTTAPRLDLQAQISADGQINANWQSFDENLAPNVLKLECQNGIGQSWSPVAVQPSPGGPERTAIHGQMRWQPDNPGRMVSVRLEVQDKAGNVEQVVRRLIVPLTFSSAPREEQPLAASQLPQDPFASHGFSTTENASSSQQPLPAGGSPASVTETKQNNVPWPSDNTHVDVSRSSDTYQQAVNQSRSTAAHQVASDQNIAHEPSEAASVTDETATDKTATDQEATPVAGNLPPGERPRMTPSNRFNLDYSIDAVSPSGVEKVELWITRDGGKSWKLWGVDEDKESPFLVEVEDEGIYGFRVVIVGSNGLASQTPRPDDLADLWVGVDLTPPTAEVTRASYGDGPYSGQLDIQWDATDQYLGERPISLQFSEDPSGQWNTIASGLPNTGQYYWQVDSRVPQQFYLRLQARDEAGNTTTHELDDAIPSAGLIPRGRVQGLQPVEE